MNLRGALIQARQFASILYSLTTSGLWTATVHEPFTGAWQLNATEDSKEVVTKNSAVFRCITGIANDIAKLRVKLSEVDENDIWNELKDPRIPFLAVLKKPNHFQTRMEFFRSWVVSLLLHGNTYVLKERDERGVVRKLYVLDPFRVTPLVTGSGDIYYQLGIDYMSQINEEFLLKQESIYGQPVIPSEEIIHDKMCHLWNQLIGVSPLYAAALPATMGRRIQDDQTQFYANHALPGGVITAPGRIDDINATRIKEAFQTNFGGANRGKVAVLGDAMKFEATRMTADESQLAEQYSLTVEDIARAFAFPLWKLSGKFPPYSSNPEQMTVTYHADCLQPIIESIEAVLDEGLSLPPNYHTEFDISNLIRMDSASQIDMLTKAIQGTLISPNEGRNDMNKKAVKGGESPLVQKQDYNLADLSDLRQRERDMAEAAAQNPQPINPATPEVPIADRSIEPDLTDVELELLIAMEAERELVTA